MIVGRARMQARRARAMDEALAIAFASGQPLRVIINEGLRRPADMLGQESSKVELRKLDDMDWRVVSYDVQTGAQRLVRQGVAPVVTPGGANKIIAMPEPQPEHRFVDQFAIEPGEGKMVSRFEYPRSPQVRVFVLARAGGFCELCGEKGFTTRTGTVYLETHHVVPLSEHGEDSVANVVAICPNDHRRAHFGEEASDIRQRLLTLLAEMAAEQAA
jgi:5-methylcytosine-specific restriction protein A